MPKATVVSMETCVSKWLAPKWLYVLPCGLQLGQPQPRPSHKPKENKMEQKYSTDHKKGNENNF